MESQSRDKRIRDRRLTTNEQDSIRLLTEILDRRSGIDRRAGMGGTYRAQHDPNFPHCTCDECWAKLESPPQLEVVESGSEGEGEEA